MARILAAVSCGDVLLFTGCSKKGVETAIAENIEEAVTGKKVSFVFGTKEGYTACYDAASAEGDEKTTAMVMGQLDAVVLMSPHLAEAESVKKACSGSLVTLLCNGDELESCIGGECPKEVTAYDLEPNPTESFCN